METQKIEIKGVECHYRPDTTDLNCLKEVLGGCCKYNRIGFNVQKDELWLDLGANIGAFSLYANKFGAKTICFEPDKENFEVLLKNNPEGININKAFSASKDEKLQFYRGSKEGDKYRFSIIPNKKPYMELDNFYAGDFDEEVDGIKMDIEGSEFELIEKGLLPKANKLVMEYHFLKDRSFKNFFHRMDILKKIYENVYWQNSINEYSKTHENYEYFMDKFIFCWNKI